VALAAGCVIGILLAACRLSRHAILRIPATVFVEVLRNTPLLLLVFFMYFGLPEIGITTFDNTECFTVTLAVYAGAYLTEVFRAGLTAIPVAYIEAGKAIGLTALQRGRYIVLPSLSSALISLFKDTALAAAIGVPELTYGARWINVNTFQVLETWAVTAGLYLATCYVLAISLRLLERRYAMVR
jgi:His/Glu/Gln/Arg/opine family amino acid ABC transporter permease subunit